MSGNDLYYDPYDRDIDVDPYPIYRRLRDEAPLYFNERYDFWGLSRFSDVEAGLRDSKRLSSAKGDILEVVKADPVMPPGVFINEDPPLHTIHRALVSRAFTPRKMKALEEKVRAFCASCLDPVVGAEQFDFVHDIGAELPMRTIGMLVGIPEDLAGHVPRLCDPAVPLPPRRQPRGRRARLCRDRTGSHRLGFRQHLHDRDVRRCKHAAHVRLATR